jgi:hypothetical protein
MVCIMLLQDASRMLLPLQTLIDKLKIKINHKP